MFELAKTIQVNLIRPEGDVAFVCPWPSDEQLIERSRGRKIIGGAVSEAVLEDNAARNRAGDLVWLKQLAPESVEIDEYEASDICGELLACEASAPVRVAGRIELTLATVFGEIPVTVRIPSRPAIAEYERTVLAKRDVRGIREIVMRLEAGAKLFDGICEAPQGLPVIYKVAVCGAVVNYIETLRSATVNP